MSTIRDSLQASKARLQNASDSAGLDAHVVLGEVMSVEYAYLLAHPEQALTPEEEQQFAALVERLAAGEPLAYVVGKRWFYDLEFAVSPAVLIPRPETELLLEQALAFVHEHPQSAVVDVGTGSGALAVTLAVHCPEAQVYATDISADALDVARYNAQIYGAKITFLQGNLLEPLVEGGIKVDALMANLPYIASGELPALVVSRYEPRLALDGGPDGLDLIRELVAQAHDVCNAGALVLLEIGAGQSAAVLDLAQRMLRPRSVEALKDYAEHDRIIRVELA